MQISPVKNLYAMVFYFFFSSRRRHTRCSRDWSSDVCSSDLILDDFAAAGGERAVSKSYRDADDEVAQRSKAESQRAAVVAGKHAANGGFLRPQRIDGKALAVLGERLLQSLDRAACFHRDGEVAPGVFDDAAQARCGKK